MTLVLLELDTQSLEIAGIRERVRHRLAEAQASKRASDALPPRLLLGKPAGAAGRRQRRRDVLHPPHPDDLLDKVDLPLDVGPERGDLHREDFASIGDRLRGLQSHDEAEAREDIEDLLDAELGAEEPVESRHAKREVHRLRGHRIGVHDARCDCAAADLGDEGGGAIGSGSTRGAIDAALEPDRRLGDEAEAPTRPADRRRIEPRGFEQHVHGAVVDLGRLAAHDAGESDRSRRVRDQKRVVRELALHAVERRELLALARKPHPYRDTPGLVAGEQVRVERVERLPEFEHDVVGDVHDVVERTPAGGDDPLGEPVGRRANLDAADDPRGVAGAELRLVDRHRDLLGGRATSLLRGRGGNRRARAQDGAGLAGDPRHREAVGPVRGDLELEDAVGQAAILGEGRTDRGVLGQDQEATVVGAQRRVRTPSSSCPATPRREAWPS